jgi:hypothetical protein
MSGDPHKTVEARRLETSAPNKDNLGAMAMPERRRARRWELDVPLTVYGRTPVGSPFYQEADAVNASATGGLIVLRAPVREGEELLLINNCTSKEQLCRVVRVRSRDTETNEVGVVFPSSNPEFWYVPDSPNNPPEDPSDEGF